MATGGKKVGIISAYERIWSICLEGFNDNACILGGIESSMQTSSSNPGIVSDGGRAFKIRGNVCSEEFGCELRKVYLRGVSGGEEGDGDGMFKHLAANP